MRESQTLDYMLTHVQEVKNDCDGYSRNSCIQTGVLDLNPKKIQELQAKKAEKIEWG